MDLETLHERIEKMERELDRMQSALHTCKLELESIMIQRHITLESQVTNNNEDIKLLQKIVFSVIGIISLAVVYAWLRNIGL